MPFLVLTPYLDDLEHIERGDGCYYVEFVAEAARIDGLNVIDPTQDLISQGDLSIYYVSDAYGGHLSAEGNRALAGILAGRIAHVLTGKHE